MKGKIAVVVQRYGMEINGGAEYHARLIAENLSGHFPVEVFASSALDYVTWEPHFADGREMVANVPVNRFHVRQPRDPLRFGRIQQKVFFAEHTLADELLWLEEEGPMLPDLLECLQKRQKEFAFFLFFSYRYYHSYHGVLRFPGKSILVPTAEHDEVIYLKLFRSFFHLPVAIVYNSLEEQEMIQRISANQKVYGDIVGVGSNIPEVFDPEGVCRKYGLVPPYILYIGRLDENKGVPQLFDYYQRYVKETGKAMPLVLIGRSVISIPRQPFIRYLGFISEKEKFDLLKGAECLIIPSQYESLSMVCLEAWALEKTVLVNGRTNVLKGQCRRSQAGLWFENYDEFCEALTILLNDTPLRQQMASRGKAFFSANYSWKVIVNKYLRIFENLSR